jgi:hypothetical protein
LDIFVGYSGKFLLLLHLWPEFTRIPKQGQFLRDTLDAYDNYKRIRRAHELRVKEELTDAEKELLEKYKADLCISPYLK